MKKSVILLLVALSAFATNQAWALSFEPLSVRFAPSGRDSIQTVRVQNTQAESIAVRIQVTTRELQPGGEEVRRPADDRFVVFPNRLYLHPGQTQAVRVQWRGGGELRQELAYRIIVEQVAVQQESLPVSHASTSLRFTYRYVGALYVTPRNARPDLVLHSYRTVTAPEDHRADTLLVLEFENRGTGHAIVDGATLVVRGTTRTGEVVRYLFASDQLRPLAGANFLAGARLVQTVQLPQPLAADSIELDYSFTLSR